MTAYRPEVQHQGPDSSCNIEGILLGWESCTPYSAAMGIERATLGQKKPSGCTVRRYSGDKSGGMMLSQVAAVARSQYGVVTELRVGSNVARPGYVASECRKGRGFILQGNASALLGHREQSTAGPVNHAVWVNEVRGDDGGEPEEALVYDPAADGRKRPYHVDEASTWWPWDRVKAFAADLRPWGDGDPRKLGPGWLYCLLFPDTEPHVLLRFGAAKTSPFPDRTRAECPPRELVNVRAEPDADGDIVGHLPNNEVFTAYQTVVRKGRRWYGNRIGTKWVNGNMLSHEGGST